MTISARHSLQQHVASSDIHFKRQYPLFMLLQLLINLVMAGE